jgi:hypothetical protein
MKYYNRSTWISIIILLLGFYIFLIGKNEINPQHKNTNKDLIRIPLMGEISEGYSEISGLTWYKDQLILLPQYPNKFLVNNVGSIFKISKKEIIDWITNSNTNEKLSATRIEFDVQKILDDIYGFQGFESVVVTGDKIFLTIESIQDGIMRAFLIEGLVIGDMEKIMIHNESLRLLPMPVQIINCTYESMIACDHRLYIFYEANGKNINESPKMINVNLENGDIRLEPFLNIEYRITDATALDDKGCFWVLNYYWPGDFRILNPVYDRVAGTVPPLEFSQDIAIERLIELNYSGDKIQFSETQPIVLGLGTQTDSRNWEGVVRLENLGFILATDKFPETILAFLPYE